MRSIVSLNNNYLIEVTCRTVHMIHETSFAPKLVFKVMLEGIELVKESCSFIVSESRVKVNVIVHHSI